MISRENLVHEMVIAIVAEVNKNPNHWDGDALAAAALDVVMARVGEPVAEILEDASPFGKLAADHIRRLAAK